jgi:hypothetical protein
MDQRAREIVLVSHPFVDPAQPTTAAPGSAAKIAILEARARARRELFVEGDAAGVRQVAPRQRPNTISRRSVREWQLIQVLSHEPQSFKKLARLSGISPRSVHQLLALLKEAGVAEASRKGWQLTRLQV